MNQPTHQSHKQTQKPPTNKTQGHHPPSHPTTPNKKQLRACNVTEAAALKNPAIDGPKKAANQPSNQQLNATTNQPTNKPTTKSMTQASNKTASQPLSVTTKQPANKQINELLKQPSNQQTRHPTNQTTSQLINHTSCQLAQMDQLESAAATASKQPTMQTKSTKQEINYKQPP